MRSPLLSRLLRSVDFENVLQKRSQIQSAHFALHHLADWPAPRRTTCEPELSTADAPTRHEPVDESSGAHPSAPESARQSPAKGVVWLGAVVPKRHARRSVTRSLLKRQIRAAVRDHAPSLAGGLWVVRLRAPFDRAEFPSAASIALRHVVRAELVSVLSRAGERARG